MERSISESVLHEVELHQWKFPTFQLLAESRTDESRAINQDPPIYYVQLLLSHR
jgi:hypothetical protein